MLCLHLAVLADNEFIYEASTQYCSIPNNHWKDKAGTVAGASLREGGQAKARVTLFSAVQGPTIAVVCIACIQHFPSESHDTLDISTLRGLTLLICLFLVTPSPATSFYRA